MDIDEVKKALTSSTRRKRRRVSSTMLSTGSTLLNVAISKKWNGGLPKGQYFFFVGDSQSGKTFLTLTCFAEACKNPAFADYRLIFDNAENGALMDFEKFFGKAVAERVEPPNGTKSEPIYSELIEEFYVNLIKNLEKGPCIYVLDSMDVLTSKYEIDKFAEKQREIEGGAKAKGDFGDGKAKINSRYLRRITSKLRSTGSILIVINQTRDNVDAGLFGPKQTRSGGRSLKFYACVEIWSSVGSKIKKTVRGKDRVIGMISKVRVEKNRVQGSNASVEFPIYYQYGIDDLGGCVDYLVSEKTWTKNKSGIITASGIEDNDLTMKRLPLIRHIEDTNKEDVVRKLVQDTWLEIEAECSMHRKPRYE